MRSSSLVNAGVPEAETRATVRITPIKPIGIKLQNGLRASGADDLTIGRLLRSGHYAPFAKQPNLLL